MKRRKASTAIGLVLSCLTIFFLVQVASGQEVPRMTKEELKGLLGKAEVIVLDVRVGTTWSASKWKIQGAVREDPKGDIKAWSEKYPKDKTIVLYCS